MLSGDVPLVTDEDLAAVLDARREDDAGDRPRDRVSPPTPPGWAG